MALRRRGRQEGDAGAPDRPQRAGRHSDVAGDRRCPARLRRPGPHEGRASGLCPAPAEQCRSHGRALLGEQAGRAGKPARPAGRQGAARRDPAVRLLRLSLPPALQPGRGGAGRRLRLPGQRPHAGRLRRHRLAGALGRDRRDDLHRQPQQRRLREGSRPRHRAGGGGDQRLQSRQVVGQGGHDAGRIENERRVTTAVD